MSTAKLEIELRNNTEEEIETSVTIEGKLEDILPAYMILTARIFEGIYETNEELADEFINNLGNDIKETIKILKEQDNEQR
jgi:exo-beta-1,3-glucanase (GH17 family)